jgi:hypothetical protein
MYDNIPEFSWGDWGLLTQGTLIPDRDLNLALVEYETDPPFVRLIRIPFVMFTVKRRPTGTS